MAIVPKWLNRMRQGWDWDGSRRPEFALQPAAGQESVWDYPRPPRLEADARAVEVRLGEVLIASAQQTLRLCETAAPPTFYLPPDSVCWDLLKQADGTSLCEWKGSARYWTVDTGAGQLERVAWSYPDPFPEYEALRDHVAFYPRGLECTVQGERVVPQPGGFYGGWITKELVGPFKGEPGSQGW